MTKTRRDWLGYAATAFALVVTFNAEYEIALACHINEWVAYAVPGALDVYVLRALQVKRDVFLTVMAMVLVNAASHLVAAGVLAVSPALIVSVSAIAPLVLWRAHVLKHDATGTVSVPVASPPVPVVPPVTVEEHAREIIDIIDVPESESATVLPFLRAVPPAEPRTPANSQREQERFLANVLVPQVENGCMEWTGTKNQQGYGRISLNGKNQQAHRVGYELWEQSVPSDLALDHLCRNTSCVRPDHLEPVTHGENVRRGWEARKEQGGIERSPAAPVKAFPDLISRARELNAGTPVTVRSLKRDLRVGTRKAQQIIRELGEGNSHE